MQSPKEDPNDKKDRLRERKLATQERSDAAQETAADLTTDLRSVYGLRGVSMFMRPKPKAPKPNILAGIRNVEGTFNDRDNGR